MPSPSSNARRLAKRALPSLASLVVLAAMLTESALRDFLLVNLGVQLVIFVGVACIPGWRTLRMSYVDIAWPWGLVALGVLTLAMSDRSPLAIAVAVVFLVMGGRMGIAALALWRHGELDRELPRYRFQRKRWAKATLGSERLDLVAEILVQAISNITVMAVPAALVIAIDGAGMSAVAAAGVILWAVSWVLESVADLQKLRFVRSMSTTNTRGYCDVGLWNYSRHPNYFFQWMQWNAIIVLCLPVLRSASVEFTPVAAIGAGLGLFALSASMYWCLVFYTGAVPAEYYSAQKRPGYRDYQARTNRFMPGFSRHKPSAGHIVS
ncbi:DUF1295 domain-containing protein [Nocardia amamiensis]|uniref:DUF1295 domain-containing protein n=1 Tax=Nocardia amamiensis TaxID=404578 RepID=UPI0033E29267